MEHVLKNYHQKALMPSLPPTYFRAYTFCVKDRSQIKNKRSPFENIYQVIMATHYCLRPVFSVR